MSHDLTWFWNELAACNGDLSRILELIAQRAAEVVGEASVLMVVSDDGQVLEPAAVYHTDPEMREVMRDMFASGPLPIGESVVGMVAARREAVMLDNVDPEAMAAMASESSRRFLERHRIHSFMIVPMVAAGEVVGTLGVTRISSATPYADDDRLILEALAEQAALALDDARRAPTKMGSPEYEALFRYSLDGVLLTEPNGRILAANPAACELLARSEAEICRLGRSGLVINDDRLAQALAVRSVTGRTRGELSLRRGDGKTLVAEVSSAVFSTDLGMRTVISFRDIGEQADLREQLERQRTELERQRTELEELVDQDPLTGLLNRRGFSVAAKRLLAVADRDHADLQLIFVDLDGLKAINDRSGHLAGDEAIKRVGAAIDDAVREVDVAARLAGDEFVLLLFDASEQDALRVVDRIAKALEAPGPDGRRLTFSAGVAGRQSGSGLDLDALVDLADKRMYQQKVLQRVAAHRHAARTD